ncbi:hypothetical protein B7463_g10837, partial [Scytalidium lignicola]
MLLKFSIAVLAAVSFSGLAFARGVHSSRTTVEGPITGGSRGHPFGAWVGDISDIGYVEEEYFISGDAVRYSVIGNLTIDGHWTLTVNDTASYKTRILVRRPINRKHFNGEVIVEWINVSGGYDIMISDGPGVYEAGYAFVGVSAQFVGLIGYEPDPIGLTEWDPERYGSLSIPDDALSYDIFTQAAQVLREGKILGSVKPKHIIATGESQSGIRVLAYANGVQPLTNAFDAIIPVIAAGNSADFSSAPAKPNADPNQHSRSVPSKIRTDLKIPVFELSTETEGLTYYLEGIRQPDTRKFRYWEIAGGSHANTPLLAKIAAYTARDEVPNSPSTDPNIDSVSWLPVLDSVYRHVSKWIARTAEPPKMPKFTINSTGTALARDANGNIIGGVRLPELTVPIATYQGNPLNLLGSQVPFTADKLRELYHTHFDYVLKVTAAESLAVAQGIILPYRIPQYIQNATTANVPPA